MMLLNLPPIGIAALLTTLVVGLTVHEFAHAWSAYRFGDTTAYSMGRLTLDPRRHLDPIGSLMFLFVGFGWAKPVPISPERLGRWGTLIVSIAGPVSNILLAVLGAMLVRTGLMPVTADWFLRVFVTLNIMLAVFNMLPIAPLDGWRVLFELVPRSYVHRMKQIEPYGGMILMLLIVFGTIRGRSVLGTIINVPVQIIESALLGSGIG